MAKPRHRYVTDGVWKRIKQQVTFCCSESGRNHTYQDLVDGILHIIIIGAQGDSDLRNLKYPPYATLNYYYDTWRKNGIWDKILKLVPGDVKIKLQCAV